MIAVKYVFGAFIVSAAVIGCLVVLSLAQMSDCAGAPSCTLYLFSQ